MTVTVDDTNLKAIADAIREKNGTEETYKPSEMAEAIKAIKVGGAEEKTTATIRVLGIYDKYNSYCGIYDVGEIKPISGTTYNETLEVEKSERLYIRAGASSTSNEKYATITLNGVVMENTLPYILNLTDYSEVTLVFSLHYDNRFYSCAIVTK